MEFSKKHGLNLISKNLKSIQENRKNPEAQCQILLLDAYFPLRVNLHLENIVFNYNSWFLPEVQTAIMILSPKVEEHFKRKNIKCNFFDKNIFWSNSDQKILKELKKYVQ